MIQLKRIDNNDIYISARNVESIKEDPENKNVAFITMVSGQVIEADLRNITLYDLIRLITLEDNNENPR